MSAPDAAPDAPRRRRHDWFDLVPGQRLTSANGAEARYVCGGCEKLSAIRHQRDECPRSTWQGKQ